MTIHRRVILVLAGLGLSLIPAVGHSTTPHLHEPEPRVQLPPLDPPTLPVVNVAHRGSWGAPDKPPEATLAAYSLAAEHGAHGIEADATMSADGHVVVFHDRTLLAETDAVQVFPGRPSYRVVDFTLAELRQLTVGDWHEPQGIPTLEEVLALGRAAGVGVLIDMKPDHSAGIVELEPVVVAVLEGLGDTEWVNERVTVGGFLHDSLQLTLAMLAERDLHPEGVFIVNFVISASGTVLVANPSTPGLVAPGMTLTQVRDALAAAGYGYFGLGLLSVTGVPVNNFTTAAVDHFRAGGVELNFFSNDPASMTSFVDRGVSSILTDHPERLSGLLRPTLHLDAEPNAGPFVHATVLEASATPGVASQDARVRYWRLGHSRNWEAWPEDDLLPLPPGRHDLVVSAIDEHGYELRRLLQVVMQPPAPPAR